VHPFLNPSRLPLRMAAGALLVEIAHLAWEQLHGGILTHHFLRSDVLPGFSNAWGLLLLPALAAWAGARIERRLAAGTRAASVIAGGLTALLWGLAISLSFVAGLQELTSSLFFGMLVGGLLLPAFRAECWLGLVLGMSFTFGAVIPTTLGGVVAGLSAIIHLGIWPAMVRVWVAFRRD